MADAHDELVSSFCSVTGVTAEEAIEHLSSSNWDYTLALGTYFQDQDADESEDAPSEPAYTGPRTLDGRPAPSSTSSSSARSAGKQPQKKKGLMTMSSLRGGGHEHDDHDGHDDDEADSRGPRDLFAGGEKSGLAVQDPATGGPSSNAQRAIRDIIAKAKANRPSEEAQAGPSQASSSRSWGAGQTLGGEGTESRPVPDPSARPTDGPRRGAPPAPEEVQVRLLHIWQDGFSIDDGPLHRFDDPANAADLQMIRQGKAPLHLMNVRFGAAVDVKLHQHKENWYQLPRVYRPFSGEGYRLGAAGPSSAAAAPAAPAAAAASSSSSSPAAAAPPVDESQPTVMIRVSLPDGTRLPARFNTSQTIGDVYDFAQRALPAAQQNGRAIVLTTFPAKEHTDRSVVLGETDELKRGGVVNVKWA